MISGKKVFLIGVGGAGVSSLAKYLQKSGYKIYGSDRNKNSNVQELIKNYDLIFFDEHKKENLINKDFDFLIYSPAVSAENPERLEAKKRNIKEYSYPEFLGLISQEKFTISIAGTNGKTTTTTMVGEILDEFNLKPTVIVGGVSKKFNSNFLWGESNIFVVESCEYKKSFLNISPNIIALTNITPDHLDYFKNFENYKKVFEDFLDNLKGGEKILICNKEDKNLKSILEKAKNLNIKIIDYKKYKIDEVSIPGEYNRKNAQVALAVADYFSLNLDKVRKYLKNNFLGSGRRFEYLGQYKNGLKIYDDYAHNPEALDLLYSAVKEKFKKEKNILIFQPHLFSRTQDFFDEFIEAISKFDIVYLLPIYEGREDKNDYSINSKMLFEKVKIKNKNTYFCESFDNCVQKIQKEKYNDNFVAFTVGAGDVNEKVGKKLLDN